MSLPARLGQTVRSLARHVFAEAYERSLRWVTIENLDDVEVERLGPSSRLQIPPVDTPLLIHGRDAHREYLELPAPTSAIIKEPLYSSKFQIVFLSRHRILADTINDKYPFRIGFGNLYGRPIRRISGYATSFRARWSNYYHLLIDVLPRLELLRHPYFERFEEISLLCPGGLRPLEKILLSRMGLPPRTKLLEVEEDVLVQPERYVHVSYPTLRFCGAVPAWYRDRIRETLLPNRPSTRTNRILISRQRASKRRVLNFSDLERALRPLGFEVVELESLDLDRQIELFYDAEAIVAAHGAGLTNVLFSDQVRVVEIFPSWYVVPHYLYLCQSLGHPYHYCVSKHLPEGADLQWERRSVLENLMQYNDADFVVDVNAVVEGLRRVGIV